MIVSTHPRPPIMITTSKKKYTVLNPILNLFLRPSMLASKERIPYRFSVDTLRRDRCVVPCKIRLSSPNPADCIDKSQRLTNHQLCLTANTPLKDRRASRFCSPRRL